MEMIQFDPRKIQKESLEASSRFNAEVWHRRAGKSVVKVIKLIRAAVACPFDRGRYAYLGPTQEQVKDIAWQYLDEYAGRIPGVVFKETAKEVYVPQIQGGTSRIKLYGVDNPKQRLRGMYLDGLVPDEYQDIPSHVWNEQARPMLADGNRRAEDLFGYPNQWADFIGTPKGRNQLYKMWFNADRWSRGLPVQQEDIDTGKQVDVFSTEWRAAIYRASETGLIDRKELMSALASMGRSKYMQEFECSWDAVVEGAIFGPELEDLRERGRVMNVQMNPNRPVNTAWDLGWNDLTSIWFFQQIGDAVFVIDYYDVSHTSLPEIVADLAAKRYKYGYHLLPHDIAVHELGTGKERRAILQELGIRVTPVPKIKSKFDAVAAAQALLPRCYFDEANCAIGLDGLALYRRERDPRLDVLREAAVKDWSRHPADAFMTLAQGIKRHGGGLGIHNPPVSET